jgi:predicted dithiol-disulfide oxidoreductase (DUF899 family)
MTDEIKQLQKEILEKKKRLAELRRAQEPMLMEDYSFASESGPVRLSELFGDKQDLLTVHNMGESCDFCTLWADGFNGVAPELASRSAFVLVSPDPLPSAVAFARSRGWRFPVVVDEDKAFSTKVGRWQDGDIYPGVSGFHKDENGVVRKIATADLGEGDDFCAVWHLLDLLKDGWNGWAPNRRL